SYLSGSRSRRSSTSGGSWRTSISGCSSGAPSASSSGSRATGDEQPPRRSADACGGELPERRLRTADHRSAMCEEQQLKVELVEPVSDAVHGASEGIAQVPRVAIVMAVSHQDVLGGATLLEPSESFGREHRVDHHALAGEIEGADIHADALVACGPVPKPG